MKKIIKYSSVLLTSAAVVALPVFSASAQTAQTTVTAQVQSVISVQVDGNVNLNISPSGGQGKASSGETTVKVSTNNPTGFSLKISSQTAERALVKDSDKIEAHAGTFAAPSTLAADTWGYRVASGSFGSGDMAPQENQDNLAGTFAGVPANSAADTIKNHGAAAQDDETKVLFGAKVSSSKPAGNYTGTVVFTATAN